MTDKEVFMEKKEWKEPELTVIIRCKPEESVLSVCKSDRFSCGSSDGPAHVIASS